LQPRRDEEHPTLLLAGKQMQQEITENIQRQTPSEPSRGAAAAIESLVRSERAKQQPAQDIQTHQKPGEGDALLLGPGAKEGSVRLKDAKISIRMIEQILIAIHPVNGHPLPLHQKNKVILPDGMVADQANHSRRGLDSLS
jgi:hypothetical protein